MPSRKRRWIRYLTVTGTVLRVELGRELLDQFPEGRRRLIAGGSFERRNELRLERL